MIRTIKPKNARSKRALLRREPKVHEHAKQAVFIRGSSTSQTVLAAMGDLLALKKPDGILFGKRNGIHPFDDATSLEFFAEKNDASLFVVGTHSKKRPNNLTFVRMFNGKVLDMLELGIGSFRSISQTRGPTCPAGTKPLMVFIGSVFETHNRYQLLRNLLLDFFRGRQASEADIVAFAHVIVVSSVDAPLSAGFDSGSELPPFHFRSYVVSQKRSAEGSLPEITLEEMGPAIDLHFRRVREPDQETLKLALRRPRPVTAKPKKNITIDPLGDALGRVHVGQQDLHKLQSRKVKGLKRSSGAGASGGPSGGPSGGASGGASKRPRQDKQRQ